MSIRTLRADEIETRVASTTKDNKRCNVLLYKTARTDYDLLDEVFGAGNWQNEYKEIKSVMYCGIGVFIDGKWVWKWNAGVESQGTGEDDPNNQKGEASDSFKRAGFCWGIGRELYLWKDIWVDLVDGDINSTGKTRVRFEVKEIAYDKNGEPLRLVLTDTKGNKRYETGKKVQAPKSDDSATLPATPNIPTPQAEKTLDAPKTTVKPLSAPTPEELNALKERIKAQNVPVQKEIIKFAFSILNDQLGADGAVAEAKNAMVAYLTEKLKLNLKTVELVKVDGRAVTLEDTTPLIPGNVVLIIDELFWRGNKLQQGFEQFVKDRLPFGDVEV